MADRTDHRPDPEDLLRRVQAGERRERRGRLKVFLGYAPRVGKSFRMFDEGRRRKQRGQDVVIGSLQGRLTPDLETILANLEVIPPVASTTPAACGTSSTWPPSSAAIPASA
jgi:two-component system, OmpR family, sensor histidine kinase KdpD